MEYGGRIKALRLAVNLTQEDFASRLKVSKGFISNLEKGRVNPSDQLLRLISYEYSSSEDWLQTGEGKMFLSPDDVVRRNINQFGDKAYYEALKRLLDENGAVALAILTPRPGSDPDLDRMIGLLADIWQYGDEDLKTWARVQFARAFPPDLEDDLLKKRAGEREQAASVG